MLGRTGNLHADATVRAGEDGLLRLGRLLGSAGEKQQGEGAD
jgi:hypothetical protein